MEKKYIFIEKGYDKFIHPKMRKFTILKKKTILFSRKIKFMEKNFKNYVENTFFKIFFLIFIYK